MRTAMRFTVWALASLGTALGQGSLTPPGPPAPSMKTLAQIEPRTPIGSLPCTIHAPGAYYLTTNLNGGSGGGITVSADNVTLDLGGFTLAGGTGDGISTPTAQKNLVVRNGVVQGWANRGIGCPVSNRVRIEQLVVTGNGGGGVNAGVMGALTDCSVQFNGGNGVTVGDDSRVASCNVTSNSVTGIATGNRAVVRDCVASLNTTGISAASGTSVTGCSVTGNRGDGIRANSDCVLLENLAGQNGTSGSGDGIRTTGTGNRIEGNLVRGNNGYGVRSQAGADADITVRNCAQNNIAGNYQPASGEHFGPLGIPATAASAWANF